MRFPRTSGILLHPTSLPSPYGIGDLGPSAYRFVDFLSGAAQRLWQMLPLGPTGFGNSPYSAYSALAGNPLLISPDSLVTDGLLQTSDCATPPAFPLEQVDFDGVKDYKTTLFRNAFKVFQTTAEPALQQEFQTFIQTHAHWLDDYALFMALKDEHHGASWTAWERAIAQRDPDTLAQKRQELNEAMTYHQFLQFQFFRQWTQLKQYANERNVQIIGDIPIYVAHDSVDVWANPTFFRLNPETGAAAEMAGVPPDYFSNTGQLWGNPVYNWEALQADSFRWWVQRFRGLLEYVDIIRIDHFRGFRAYWSVPEGEQTAVNGRWIEAPGPDLFQTVRNELGTLPIMAEDLGVITPDVDALRDQFEFPGMKVLQFAFDGGDDNPFLPKNYPTSNCVVYTGTHDNDTTVGWFNSLSHDAQDRVRHYLGGISPSGIHWDLIRYGHSSTANQSIIPLQDILGLGTEHRMNFPSKPDGNWAWRYRPDALVPILGDRLRTLTETFGRIPQS